MFSDITLLIINIACIAFLVVMLAILATATRMKGGAGWAAVIIVTTTVPMYLANLTRDLASDYFLPCWYLGTTLNTLCFPATWFFTHRQLDKSFRLTTRSLLHAVPAIVSLLVTILYYAPMSSAEIEADRAFIEAGNDTLPAIINNIIMFGQFFAYFAAMFFYVRKRLKYLRNNYSDSDYLETRWLPSFLWLFFVMYLIVVVVYVLIPRTDTWLIPILNSLGMGYLVYIVVWHSTTDYLNRLAYVPASSPEQQNVTAAPTVSDSQMKEICDKVTEYLQNSKAYTNPELSAGALALETGIHSRSISLAINGYLHRNFFDLVNEMRVGEAKRLLKELNSGYTVESVYPDCGFSSARSFFRAFQKYEGVSPAQWLNKTSNS